MSGPWLCLQSCFLPRGRPSGPGETSAPLPASLRPAPLSPPPPWPCGCPRPSPALSPLSVRGWPGGPSHCTIFGP